MPQGLWTSWLRGPFVTNCWRWGGMREWITRPGEWYYASWATRRWFRARSSDILEMVVLWTVRKSFLLPKLRLSLKLQKKQAWLQGNPFHCYVLKPSLNGEPAYSPSLLSFLYVSRCDRVRLWLIHDLQYYTVANPGLLPDAVWQVAFSYSATGPWISLTSIITSGTYQKMIAERRLT